MCRRGGAMNWLLFLEWNYSDKIIPHPRLCGIKRNGVKEIVVQGRPSKTDNTAILSNHLNKYNWIYDAESMIMTEELAQAADASIVV